MLVQSLVVLVPQEWLHAGRVLEVVGDVPRVRSQLDVAPVGGAVVEDERERRPVTATCRGHLVGREQVRHGERLAGSRGPGHEDVRVGLLPGVEWL